MKYEIEIPDLPEGWKAVAYRKPVKGIDYVLTQYGVRLYIDYTFDPMLIVEKIKPRRIVLVETEEDNHGFHDLCGGSRYSNQYIDDICLSNKKKIWREVKDE